MLEAASLSHETNAATMKWSERETPHWSEREENEGQEGWIWHPQSPKGDRKAAKAGQIKMRKLKPPVFGRDGRMQTPRLKAQNEKQDEEGEGTEEANQEANPTCTPTPPTKKMKRKKGERTYNGHQKPSFYTLEATLPPSRMNDRADTMDLYGGDYDYPPTLEQRGRILRKRRSSKKP